MKYEDIVFAWNAQHVNNGPLAGDGRTWDKISDRERIEFALMMATRQEQPIAKIVCGTGGGCSLEFTNGADSLDYAGCDVYLRPPIAQEPHPPTRHCMCDDCAPSFEPTPDGLAPAVTDAMALAFHSAITDSSIGQGEVDEIKTGLRAALCAAKPVENQEPVAWHTDDYLSDKSATTYDHDVMKQWELKGWPITAHYTVQQPCPECEKLKTMSATEACATIPAIGEYVAQLEHQRDELAAQVEKMREALNTWKLAEQHALSYGHLEPEAGCADAYDHATRERNEALALPDFSTGILNRVRAETLSNAAIWFRTMRPFEDGSFDVQPGGHSEIAAVLIDRLAKQAADMEAVKCQVY